MGLTVWARLAPWRGEAWRSEAAGPAPAQPEAEGEERCRCSSFYLVLFYSFLQSLEL